MTRSNTYLDERGRYVGVLEYGTYDECIRAVRQLDGEDVKVRVNAPRQRAHPVHSPSAALHQSALQLLCFACERPEALLLGARCVMLAGMHDCAARASQGARVSVEEDPTNERSGGGYRDDHRDSRRRSPSPVRRDSRDYRRSRSPHSRDSFRRSRSPPRDSYRRGSPPRGGYRSRSPPRDAHRAPAGEGAPRGGPPFDHGPR